MRTTMPQKGRARGDVIAELKSMKEHDVDWQHGRAPLYVFSGGEDVYDIGRTAFFEYFSENALGARRAFPSVKRMEEEVIDMALGLFGAPDGAAGFMSTGGTESIVEAVQTARNFARKQRGDDRHRGNLVLAVSAHPAFDKAARLMDLEVRRVAVGPDYRAEVMSMDAAIDGDTIMLVGSAPCFPYGVIDPIEELGRIALKRSVWLHVDACVGGYLAPFVRMNGRPIPAFDMSVPGVASLSADLHKFGFCPKPASTVFYATAAQAELHQFDFDGWPNGRFLTSTIVGTRPAGGVAAAWAVFNYLGIDGYRRVADQLMRFVDAYRSGIEDVPGLAVVGDPHLSIVAYGSAELDIFRVAEVMGTKGWLPGLVQRPKAIHRMMSLLHEPSLPNYLADLRAAVGVVRQSGDAGTLKATY